MTRRPAGRRRRGVSHRRRGRGGATRSSLVLAVAVVAAVVTLRPSGLPALDRVEGSGRQASSGPVAPASPPPTDRAAARVAGRAPAPKTTAPAPPATQVRPPRSQRRSAAVTFTYSVRSVGPVSMDLREFAAVARHVYGDPRGWSSGGLMAIREVATGGDFTLWIATPERVEAFGSVCDRTWSCRNGRNVVVNEARWLSGSPSGVLAGDLPSYRAMVINHETGHWLGLSHRRCPAPGAPAPLMQQQSIALQGCRANAWPTAPERAAVASRHLRPAG